MGVPSPPPWNSVGLDEMDVCNGRMGKGHNRLTGLSRAYREVDDGRSSTGSRTMVIGHDFCRSWLLSQRPGLGG